jgi:acetyl esterase/lipase
MRRGFLPAVLLLIGLLPSCTVTIGERDFLPQGLTLPKTSLVAPAGYRMDEAMVDLPGLGHVHTVRLDNPSSDAVIVYSGGNGSFVSDQTGRAAMFAQTTGADIILYDYPGRGGTDVAPGAAALSSFGPAFVAAMRQRGWIGAGPLFFQGMSLGGSLAASLARGAGANGLIIENSADDIPRVARSLVPVLARPFVHLQVSPELARFTYTDYVAQARAPVLLIVSRGDKLVRPSIMRRFAATLRARGVAVTMVEVPGEHGRAMAQPAMREAVRAFFMGNAAPR